MHTNVVKKEVIEEIATKVKSQSKNEKGEFVERHIGPREEDLDSMLSVVGANSLEDLIEKTVPKNISIKKELNTGKAISEHETLKLLSEIAGENKVYRSFLGMGYSNCFVPTVVQRNILENPGWYTQYTPYQAEISQGRLEALINFQTMVSDLTGLPIANSSLLDEATAAAEAMTFCQRVLGDNNRTKFFIADNVHPQTAEVICTRAEPLAIEVVKGDWKSCVLDKTYCGILLQYPATDGAVINYEAIVKRARDCGALVVVAADLLALTLLKAPGEWGADVVLGNSQRFGVPFGFGGPHAAFFATKEAYVRHVPGRIVGVSKDASGKPAYRLALQVREQHIRREKATSNICTAQVLLAIMASMYAVYHGPKGLRRIANQIHSLAMSLATSLEKLGHTIVAERFFDTIRVKCKGIDGAVVIKTAENKGLNLRLFSDGSVGIALDETTTKSDVEDVASCFVKDGAPVTIDLQKQASSTKTSILGEFARTSDILTHPVFNKYHSETEMLRYINRLQAKDLSLTTSMIPLGSCTMKLNATTEMAAVTWKEFAGIHPFAPLDQAKGYLRLTKELERMLSEITGFAATSLQPNAGSQGEYAGLLAILAYHKANGQGQRNVCLIPDSAHGTNPASAIMVGMKVVTVKCDTSGNVDLVDLKKKAEEYRESLSALMITYPSTHGVFEEDVREICKTIHEFGGQVYMDGANLNAQVGVCRPGEIGADVCHVNLHKTFCIPHGGGGPGVGPICVAAHLAPYLPGHFHLGKQSVIGAVSAAPFGSAGILPISWAYVKMMGSDGLKYATAVAILNANYIASRLEPHYPVLYRGKNGFVAHECILDLRNFKRTIGIEVQDVAKRLMDYGFHAPTVSFPVVETLMVEPTESESKEELDRFCDAMIAIRQEIREVEEGKADKANNVLKNAPHTAEIISSDTWAYPYSREKAAYPLPYLRAYKYWPPVSRIDSAYGDRNLFCSCVPISC